MATLIRIKRPLACEPAESIVVKSKRQRTVEGVVGGEAEEGGNEAETTLPSGVLQRVGTVSCKDEAVRPDILRVINIRRRTGGELRRTYKQATSRITAPRPITKQQQLAHLRAHQDRQRLLAQYRGDIKDLGKGEESEELEGKKAKPNPSKVTTEKENGTSDKENGTTDKENGTTDKEERVQAEGGDVGGDETEDKAEGKTHIKYYDAELPWSKDSDVITCNGLPLESEKFVYDLYYSPEMVVDWTEFVCQVEKFEYPGLGSADETPDDDDDDENEENNWRNDYPEEDDDDDDDDDEPEEEDHYMDRVMHYSIIKDGSDESFDAEDYDDDDNFDDDGKLTEYGRTNVVNPLRLHFSQLTMGAGDGDSEDADKEDNGDTEDDME